MYDESDDTHNTIINVRVPPTLRKDFVVLCNEHNLKLSEAIRRLMQLALSKGKFPEAEEDFTIKQTMSEIVMVTYIYRVWESSGKDIKVIAKSLAAEHGVTEDFIYHCFGRMVLSGTRL